MAGRGRGRGRGGPGLSFNVELLGFGRGDALPAPTGQPPPNYPPLEFRPAPLVSGTETDYLVALTEELSQGFETSEFHVEKQSKKKDIDRYSDTFRLSVSGKKANYDFSYFPKELFIEKKKVFKAKPKIKLKIKKNVDVSKKLEDLEATEKNESDTENKDDSKENADDENEQEEEFEEDEDLQEEETDYASNYFDNGENYLDEEDDNLDDEPVY